MVETSYPSRDDTEGILRVASEQTKHTGIHFLCYEDLLISPGIGPTRRSPSTFLCFNTAISNPTRSTEKDGFYGRKADSLFASLL